MSSCTKREKCWNLICFFLFSQKIYRILVTITKTGRKNGRALSEKPKNGKSILLNGYHRGDWQIKASDAFQISN